MKFKKTLLISSYVLVAALMFSVSFVAGKMGTNVIGPKETEKPEEETAVETVSENTAYSPEYQVIYEDGQIILYKCMGNIRSVIASEKVSEDVFPKEDVEELKKGVRFQRLEGAQQMFENFVS